MGSLPFLFLLNPLALMLLSFDFIKTFASMQPLSHRSNDCYALLQFKDSFLLNKSVSFDTLAYPKVASWKLESKSENEDCCQWDGVECDEDTGRVIVVELSNSCLYGSIHSNSSLFRLVHLQRLNLAGNHFNFSQIPPELGHFSRLTHLNLSMSHFAGQIPTELSKLSELSSLDLSGNDHLKFEFPVAIFKLPKLEVLDISHSSHIKGYLPDFSQRSSLRSLRLAYTEFSGKLPETIGNLVSLEELDVERCNFTGQIASSLQNLTRLTYLDLSANNFKHQSSSSISWLGKLTELTTLHLRNTKLVGEIPCSFANLTKLTSLHLGFNQLTGPIPSWVMNLPRLSVLNLCSNQLSGPVPSHIMNLTHLRELDLSSNQLQGPIPSSITELKNLEILDLDTNDLTGTMELDMFLNLQNLSILQLSFNKLSLFTTTTSNVNFRNIQVLGLASCNLMEFPNFLRNQKNLKWLDLSSNNMQGKVPKWMQNVGVQTLKYMNLSRNSLTGFEENPFALPWVNLCTLDLRFNMLQGSLPIPPPSVSFYLASHNHMTGNLSQTICNLTSLYALDLSFNNLSGTLPQCLGSFSDSLSILNLGSNNFEGSIPKSWAYRNHLRMISLTQNEFQGQVPKSLANCTMLEFLDLGNNQIDDTFPSWLGILPELRVLILRSNRFHGVIRKPETSFQFPKLRIIDLSRNTFTGKLPSEYFQQWNAMKRIQDYGRVTYMHEELMPGSIFIYRYHGSYDYSLTITNKGINMVYGKIPKMLAVIDLSSNAFQEEIPTSIGCLTGVHSINFSNNNLKGRIPSSIGNLVELESLDLSHNKLTEEIPQELTQLAYIAFLNVSNNLLTGPIPNGKQFDTFDNSSYDGNSGLCGFPLTKQCEDSLVASTNCKGDQTSWSLKELDWRIVLMGYASGLVIGITIGCALITRWQEN